MRKKVERELMNYLMGKSSKLFMFKTEFYQLMATGICERKR